MKDMYVEAVAIFREVTGKKNNSFSPNNWDEIHKIAAMIVCREDMKAKNQLVTDANSLAGMNIKDTMDNLFKKLGGGGLGGGIG